MKDYTAIVLQGIADPANRKNMEAFYISECKKAERDEFIIPELFFDSCIAKIEIFKEYFESKKFEELHNLNEALVALRQGRFKHKDEDLKNKTIEQCDHEEEQIILNRINDVRKNFIHQIQYPASIFHHDFNGHLSYADVLEMEAAIIAAKLKAGINPATSSTTTNPKVKRQPAAERYPTFESMFVDRNKVSIVLELLQNNETDYKHLYKIGAITQALVNRNILKKGIPKTYRNPLFAKTLGVTASKRALTSSGNDYEEYLTEFDLLFSKL
ncbi:MAG TPA: hypothetical protein PLQ09_01760 [Prolixibacteraceae bacterium]|nr:hypothetical protein [Prolixibacteraceae bacterium]